MAYDSHLPYIADEEGNNHANNMLKNIEFVIDKKIFHIVNIDNAIKNKNINNEINNE